MSTEIYEQQNYNELTLLRNENARLKAEREKLLAVVEAARGASQEIQAQKTIWPGEVDTLADALADLDEWRSRTIKIGC